MIRGTLFSGSVLMSKRAKKRFPRSRRVARVRPSILGRAELKYIDSTTSFEVDGNSEGINFPMPGLGDGDTSRIGSRIFIQSLHFRGVIRFFPIPGNSDTSNCRVSIALNVQSNGSVPNSEEIFANTPGQAAVGYRNKNFLKKYKILHDQLATYSPFYINNATTPATSPWMYSEVDIHVRCGFVTEFSGTTGAIADVSTNLPFLLGSKSPDPNQVATFLTGSLRVRFYDL